MFFWLFFFFLSSEKSASYSLRVGGEIEWMLAVSLALQSLDFVFSAILSLPPHRTRTEMAGKCTPEHTPGPALSRLSVCLYLVPSDEKGVSLA